MRYKTVRHETVRKETLRHKIKDERKILRKAFSNVLILDTKNPDTNFKIKT